MSLTKCIQCGRDIDTSDAICWHCKTTDPLGLKKNTAGSFSQYPLPSGGNAGLLILAAIGFGLYKLWFFLSAWNDLSAPYKYVAAFYYYIFVVPLKCFIPVWQYSSTLTSYENLNYVIGGFGVFLYGTVGIMGMIAIGRAVLNALKIKRKLLIILAPAIFSAIWFGISWLLKM